MSIIGNENIKISGRDVASYFYNTKTGPACSTGLVYWLFRRKVTVPEEQLNSMIWPYRETYFINSFLKSRITRVVPQVGKLLPQQEFKYSCGAQSLRQAAYELGICHLPNKQIYKFQGQSIEENSAEEAIYAITGGLLDTSKKKLIKKPDHGRYSFPDGMIVAARELGLDARVYSYVFLSRLYLKIKYPEEWARASALSPVKYCSVPELSLNERCIHVFKDNNSPDLHWVMQRPDGSCYDPAKSSDYKTLKEYIRLNNSKPAGISLLISERNSYPGGPSKATRITPAIFRPASEG